MPGEIKRMKMGEARRLLDYWADRPPPHIALIQVRNVVIAGLGGTPPEERDPAAPPEKPAFDLRGFIAAAGGALTVVGEIPDA